MSTALRTLEIEETREGKLKLEEQVPKKGFLS
jgi:hypothetical protein